MARLVLSVRRRIGDLVPVILRNPRADAAVNSVPLEKPYLHSVSTRNRVEKSSERTSAQVERGANVTSPQTNL